MRYLSDRELAARFGVHRSTPWQWARDGIFPKPIRLSEQCTRWREDEVAAFEAARDAVRDGFRVPTPATFAPLPRSPTRAQRALAGRQGARRKKARLIESGKALAKVRGTKRAKRGAPPSRGER